MRQVRPQPVVVYLSARPTYKAMANPAITTIAAIARDPAMNLAALSVKGGADVEGEEPGALLVPDGADGTVTLLEAPEVPVTEGRPGPVTVGTMTEPGAVPPIAVVLVDVLMTADPVPAAELVAVTVVDESVADPEDVVSNDVAELELLEDVEDGVAATV